MKTILIGKKYLGTSKYYGAPELRFKGTFITNNYSKFDRTKQNKISIKKNRKNEV